MSIPPSYFLSQITSEVFIDNLAKPGQTCYFWNLDLSCTKPGPFMITLQCIELQHVINDQKSVYLFSKKHLSHRVIRMAKISIQWEKSVL